MEEQLQERLLELMRNPKYSPSTVAQIEEHLQLDGAEQFKQLVKTLVQLEQRGDIVRSRANRYGVPERMNHLKGRFIGHAKGFGFVAPMEEKMDDIFIPPNATNGAFDGDTVLVQVSEHSHGDRREGEVTKIVERQKRSVVGTFYGSEEYSYVVPDDKKIPINIFIAEGQTLGAMEGHKVVVEMTNYPTEISGATGYVTKVLGHKNDPGVDILSIVYKHGIPTEFPEEVMEQANAIPDHVLPEQMEGRMDCRQDLTITIDGADAKDLDDAISVERMEDGTFILTVHISDVSYYVTDGSPMQEEAYERGTSVYLIDRVIPMLPHRLSNGICSLNPGVDRLTMSCRMHIDESGKVLDHEIFESVINSKERMTYDDVYHIIDHHDAELMEKYEHVVPMLFDMAKLAKILRTQRFGRGAIDFDFKESKVIVDEAGWPTEIEMIERTVSERLIEEFMLAANETVAEHFHWMQLPFLYRIHENPKEEKLQRFFEFITHFGISVKGVGNTVHPRALQEIIDAIAGLPEETVISTMLLRSMQQAKYSDQSLGHFGLSTQFYTHFTAPIRRYPDLIVHRLIRTYLLKGETDKKTTEYWTKELPEIATHTSSCERRAVDAERDVEALKKAQFMVDKVGENFEGVISSVTNFGLFIELDNTVEGLVHVRDMRDDYYNFDNRTMMMIGERTAKQYRIGDKVEVKVTNVVPEEGTIDFVLYNPNEPERQFTKNRKPRVIQTEKKPRQRAKKKGNAPIERTERSGQKKERKFYETIAKKSSKKRSRKRK